VPLSDIGSHEINERAVAAPVANQSDDSVASSHQGVRVLGSSRGTKGIARPDDRPRVSAAARLAESWSLDYAGQVARSRA